MVEFNAVTAQQMSMNAVLSWMREVRQHVMERRRVYSNRPVATSVQFTWIEQRATTSEGQDPMRCQNQL